MELKEIEEEILKIKERNKKVELNKAWETSKTRKVTICILTYLVVILFSVFVNKEGNIFLNSAVPVIGFLLSTQSLKMVKILWIKRKNKLIA